MSGLPSAKQATHRIDEDAVDTGHWDGECILFALWRGDRHEHKPCVPVSACQRAHTLTVLLPVALCKLADAPVPLPVLLVHPRQHLVRHPGDKHALARDAGPLRVVVRRSVQLYEGEVAGDVVALERGGVYGHVGFAVQQTGLAWWGGAGGHGGGGGGGGWRVGAVVASGEQGGHRVRQAMTTHFIPPPL